MTPHPRPRGPPPGDVSASRLSGHDAGGGLRAPAGGAAESATAALSYARCDGSVAIQRQQTRRRYVAAVNRRHCSLAEVRLVLLQVAQRTPLPLF